MYIQAVVIIIALSYIIGSFPTAYLIGRLNGINIFNVGSGNMGTNNVLRSLGTSWAIIVFAGDIFKGIFAVWLARQIAASYPEGLMSQASASAISAVAVVVGHNWSFFASLLTGSIRGGKGAATAGGTWLIMMPAVVIIIPLIVIALVVITTRYMSLGVLVGTVTGVLIIAALVLTNQMEPAYLLYTFVAFLIFYRHRENIQRLLAGNERRVGEKAQLPQ